MTESLLAPVCSWLAAPMDQDVSEAIERLRHAPGVQRIAVMPDVHLAADVCIGAVVATYESPAAYKDIRAVLRAQRDLVKVTRVLRPVLNDKGT